VRTNGAGIAFLHRQHWSTAHIVAAVNTVIERTAGRMKSGRPIRIDKVRRDDLPGRRLGTSRSEGPGPRAGSAGARRCGSPGAGCGHRAALSPDWGWSRCAVIARESPYLEPVRACCEQDGIPVQSAIEAVPNVWRLPETHAPLALRAGGTGLAGTRRSRRGARGRNAVPPAASAAFEPGHADASVGVAPGRHRPSGTSSLMLWALPVQRPQGLPGSRMQVQSAGRGFPAAHRRWRDLDQLRELGHRTSALLAQVGDHLARGYESGGGGEIARRGAPAGGWSAAAVDT